MNDMQFEQYYKVTEDSGHVLIKRIVTSGLKKAFAASTVMNAIMIGFMFVYLPIAQGNKLSFILISLLVLALPGVMMWYIFTRTIVDIDTDRKQITIAGKAFDLDELANQKLAQETDDKGNAIYALYAVKRNAEQQLISKADKERVQLLAEKITHYTKLNVVEV